MSTPGQSALERIPEPLERRGWVGGGSKGSGGVPLRSVGKTWEPEEAAPAGECAQFGSKAERASSGTDTRLPSSPGWSLLRWNCFLVKFWASISPSAKWEQEWLFPQEADPRCLGLLCLMGV